MRYIGCIGVFLASQCAAHADTQESMLECRDIESAISRLDCYDRIKISPNVDNWSSDDEALFIEMTNYDRKVAGAMGGIYAHEYYSSKINRNECSIHFKVHEVTRQKEETKEIKISNNSINFSQISVQPSLSGEWIIFAFNYNNPVSVQIWVNGELDRAYTDRRIKMRPTKSSVDYPYIIDSLKSYFESCSAPKF